MGADVAGSGEDALSAGAEPWCASAVSVDVTGGSGATGVSVEIVGSCSIGVMLSVLVVESIWSRSSSVFSALRKSRRPRPSARPTSGRRFGPNTSSATTRMNRRCVGCRMSPITAPQLSRWSWAGNDPCGQFLARAVHDVESPTGRERRHGSQRFSRSCCSLEPRWRAPQAIARAACLSVPPRSRDPADHRRAHRDSRLLGACTPVASNAGRGSVGRGRTSWSPRTSRFRLRAPERRM